MDYIYINPVKHGYVSNVIDWPFSTFHRDVREDYIQRIGQERSRIFRRENGGKSRVAATPYPAYSVL
jgi:hypothetical protein